MKNLRRWRQRERQVTLRMIGCEPTTMIVLPNTATDGEERETNDAATIILGLRATMIAGGKLLLFSPSFDL